MPGYPDYNHLLMPPTWHYGELLRVYYKELEEDDNFRSDFDQLISALPEPLPDSLTEIRALIDEPSNVETLLPEVILTPLRAFAQKWCLPTGRGVGDTWNSLLSLRAEGIGMGMFYRHGWGWAWFAEAPVRMPYIIPLTVLPIRYDPLSYDSPADVRRQIDRAVEQLHQNMREQLAEIEAQARAAGWSRTAPQYLDPETLTRVARRVVQAVKGDPWATIAARDNIAVETARGSVMAFAAALDVRLPPRKVGRRRK